MTTLLTQVPVSHHMLGSRAKAGSNVDHEVIEPLHGEGYVILEHAAVTAERLCDPLPKGPQRLGQTAEGIVSTRGQGSGTGSLRCCCFNPDLRRGRQRACKGGDREPRAEQDGAWSRAAHSAAPLLFGFIH